MPRRPGEIRDRELGRRRMQRFVELMGALDAEQMWLVMAVGYAAEADYSDEALAAIKNDARDVVKAARELHEYVHRLADEWKAQREEHRAE